jgi:hypothetical protein
MRAQWGPFSMDIKILNFEESSTQLLGYTDEGAYAKTYSGIHQEQKLTIKELPIQG